MIELLLPVTVTAVAALLVAVAAQIAQPHVATVVLTAAVVATTAATSALLVLLALVLLLDPHGAEWCERFLGHGSHRAIAPGLAAVGLTLVVIVRAARCARQRRRDLAAPSGQPPSDVVVVPTDRLVAYAQPGRPGCVVVSQGMLAALTREQQLVLFAHERAHLRHAHHVYIAVADVCAAAIPLLRPLASSVRFACERWADEDAASVVGERHLAARAVAAAALAHAERAYSPFGGGGTPARVAALLAPPPTRVRLRLLVVSAPGAVAVAAATIQVLRLDDVVRLLV